MTDRLRYPNAPIVEAIIEIQCDNDGEFSVERFEPLLRAERDLYPHSHQLEEVHTEIQGPPPAGARSAVPATSERCTTGLAGVSAGRERVFQARKSGFTFAHLKPYPGWTAFRDEAFRLWTRYRTIAQPKHLRRMAIRTINRIQLPGTSIEPARYLRTLPTIAPDVGGHVHGFFMQIAIDQPSIRSVAVITEAIDRTADPGRTAVILDIDLWRDQDVPQSDAELWTLFEALRNRKDDVFEACITDETRKEFL